MIRLPDNPVARTHRDWLLKALGHLEWSLRQLADRQPVLSAMDEETLQAWEALVARFARASDIFVQKVLRGALLYEDPAYRGSVRDSLDLAEKYGWIESAERWMEIRELRNLAVHEYGGEAIEESLRRMRDLCPLILATRSLWTDASDGR
ncbi:MAG: hypothetical protein VKO21_05930 [Candidatus Sericytochromatia bacterium]|nr:hypothetical protein [Candidatus Sericytochromatia bacterium]